MADGTPPRRSSRRVNLGAGDNRQPPPPSRPAPPPARPADPTRGASSPERYRPSDVDAFAAHYARVESEIAAKTRDLAERAHRINAGLKAAAQHQSEQARADTETATREVDERRAQAVADIREAAARRRSEIASRLEAIARQAAPGAFGLDPAVSWDDVQSVRGAADLVRRGISSEGPALYPLFHDQGWYLDGNPRQTVAEIQTQLLRAVAGLPLKHLRIDVFDPRIEGRLGAFAGLRSAHPAAFPSPSTGAAAFRDVLDDVMRSAASNAEAIATENVRDLGELWRARDMPIGHYRFVVVLNYPEGIDREAQDRLLRLARSGGPNGVCLLVQHDDHGAPADDGVRAADVAQLLRKSRLEDDGRLLLSGYPGEVEVRVDPPAGPEHVSQVIGAAAAGVAEDTGPVIPLAELLAEACPVPWQADSTDGLEAVIGRSGRRPMSISLRSQNPPISNALIGGAVGQGKSNLLLDIVYALTSRYSPDDLELHLLDFKRGLEFQRFAADENGRNWLPHARVLSLESDRAFGVAVLRHVVRDLEARAALFKRHGVAGLEDYRRTTGNTMPRLLLVIDEFHVLFDGDDRLVDEAVELLETLSRQGRASGIHLLLASQTTTGVSGLRVKGESIFAQFPLRISLKNTANESEAVLSQGNKAAADLTYRGEIVVNRNFGHDPEGSNERAVSAYAEPGHLERLQAQLWELSPGGEPPMVFVSTEFAGWPARVASRRAGQAALGLLGRPVEVTDQPVGLVLDEDVDQAVAVVGSDGTLALPVLASLARSLGTTLEPTRVIVIDLSAAADDDAGAAMGTVLQELAADGIRVERFGRRSAPGALGGSVRECLTSEDGPTLVLGIGWQRWSGLDDPHPLNPHDEDDFATFSLREVIEELTQRGALKDVHFVGWWSTLRSLQDQLGYGYQGVRHLVTAKLGLEDYRSLTSHSEPGIVGYPRVGHIDRASDGGPTVVVPFALDGVDT